MDQIIDELRKAFNRIVSRGFLRDICYIIRNLDYELIFEIEEWYMAENGEQPLESEQHILGRLNNVGYKCDKYGLIKWDPEKNILPLKKIIEKDSYQEKTKILGKESTIISYEDSKAITYEIQWYDKSIFSKGFFKPEKYKDKIRLTNLTTLYKINEIIDMILTHTLEMLSRIDEDCKFFLSSMDSFDEKGFTIPKINCYVTPAFYFQVRASFINGKFEELLIGADCDEFDCLWSDREIKNGDYLSKNLTCYKKPDDVIQRRLAKYNFLKFLMDDDEKFETVKESINKKLLNEDWFKNLSEKTRKIFLIADAIRELKDFKNRKFKTAIDCYTDSVMFEFMKFFKKNISKILILLKHDLEIPYRFRTYIPIFKENFMIKHGDMYYIIYYIGLGYNEKGEQNRKYALLDNWKIDELQKNIQKLKDDFEYIRIVRNDYSHITGDEPLYNLQEVRNKTIDCLKIINIINSE